MSDNTLDTQLERGQKLADQDPLATAIRRSLSSLAKRGFDLGLVIAEGQTLLGPGKEKNN